MTYIRDMPQQIIRDNAGDFIADEKEFKTFLATERYQCFDQIFLEKMQ